MISISFFRSFAATLSLVFSLSSCEKNEHTTVSGLIIGRWEWIKTVSPWTGYTSDPQTAGYTQNLEFTSHGLMKEYKDDVLIHTTTYRIESGPVEADYYLLVHDTWISSHFYITGDSLQFNEAFVDGPVIYYLRSR